MKIKLVLLIIISITMLSACVVRPSHRGHNVRVKVPVKTVLILDQQRVLEQEHQRRNIIVVNSQPARKKNCWTHSKHWHCNR